MDKNAIKKYAVWARRELIARVSQKAEQYGITEKYTGDIKDESVNGRLLTQSEQAQRVALIYRIRQDGFQQVMEEVAYTWFNRFCALRFMEVNNYLPTRIRVFTDEENAFKPQILTEAIHMEMDGLDMDKVYQLKSDNKTEELYKYLLITQCNALYSILPGMFQEIEDYTELLLPDNLLREGSVIEQMIGLIPEEDWLVPEDHDKDSIQIIGWLYQYYNAEPKDQVFANLKKNIKISKHDIPAATQLFTPDWIVRYMVENSLGRLWVEGHPDDELKAGWKYYLEEAEQEPDVQAQLAKIREEYAAIKPEDIKCIDPCMGSGHILVYMFDVLVQIYQAYGYSTREAVQSIVENNLYGLDIDDRAAQLAYFAVMMKARQYDRRFFTRNIQPHVHAIQESSYIPDEVWRVFGEQEGIARRIHATFIDAKEYGSLISSDVTAEEIQALRHRMLQMHGFDPNTMTLDRMADAMAAIDIIEPLVTLTEILNQKYDVVVTNPPYMGASGMGARLSQYVKDNYPNSKNDLFAVFIERCCEIAKKNGYQAMITQHAWMFLTSYEKLREKLLHKDFCNMIHLGAHAFEEIGGEVVQTCSFVIRDCESKGYIGTYCRLVEPNTQTGKQEAFLTAEERYFTSSTAFKSIPGIPFVYWFGSNFLNSFRDNTPLKELAAPRKGLVTLDNERFIRLWHEVEMPKIGLGLSGVTELLVGSYKWVPIQKGGLFRKWYGNNYTVVNWENNGQEIKDNIIKTYKGGSYTKEVRSEEKYFLEGITWTVVSTSKTSFRRYKEGFIFSNSGESVTTDLGSQALDYFTGLLNSKYAETVLSVLSPTMGFESGYVGLIPTPRDMRAIELVSSLVQETINTSMTDWDSFEVSWDFQNHPLIPKLPIGSETVFMDKNGKPGSISISSHNLADCFDDWQSDCESRFQQLKANEEELNRIFIDIYGLQDELTPEVEEKDVTVRRADLARDIRSFISYAVGCMFGRYSIYKPGLMYAGGDWDYNAYENTAWIAEGKPEALEFYHRSHFMPDVDGILPICDDEYFTDDIVGKFIEFVDTVYGSETLEENLTFIAKALGGNGNPKEVIRSYFLNDFYADHLKIYQKRPIYWLFDSGKKNGFKALIYMHRYAPDTIARIRTDYVHEQQSRYRTAITDLENRIISASTGERVKLNKQLTKVKAQAEELRLYEEKIHHLADQMISIDLDDGVKVNYAKFADVLAKIK